MEQYRESLATDVNARKLGPIFDLRVPAVFGMIIHDAKSSSDIIPLALEIRESKEALDFRKWALRRTTKLQNGGPKAMLIFLSEMQNLADKLAKDLGIKGDRIMLDIAVNRLHVAFLQNLLERLISTGSISPDIKRVFGLSLLPPQDWDRVGFWDPHAFRSVSLPKLLVAREVSESMQKKRDMIQAVLEIVNRFKFEVETQRLWKNLWDGDNAIPEMKTHNLLYVSACRNAEALNIDISQEAETGRGLIDFKLSTGYSERVHIEMKYFHNGRIIQGLHQLATYLKSERVDVGFYVVIDFGFFDKSFHKQYDIEHKIQKTKENIEKEEHVQIFVIYIDARKKQSASKIESQKPSRLRPVSGDAGRKRQTPVTMSRRISIQKAEYMVVTLLKKSMKPLTLADIAKETLLPEGKVFKVLEKLFQQEIVDAENRRYKLAKSE
jgi:hypothetical protein